MQTRKHHSGICVHVTLPRFIDMLSRYTCISLYTMKVTLILQPPALSSVCDVWPYNFLNKI